jgi:sulfur-oxidizing protein SoxA
MQKTLLAATAALALGLGASPVMASTPQEDLKAFQSYFTQKFPDVPKAQFVDGVYALNKDFREQWLNTEEFPPYEDSIEKGRTLFETPFANGKTFAECMPGGGVGTRQMYPHFDADSGQIVTLEETINKCLEANGEKPLKYKKGPIADLTAYIAHTSRGNTFNIEVPNDPRALAFYEQGKKHFYMKRGQLNLACADCHVANSGMYVRSDLLSPAFGNLSHFPVYRLKWQELGTPHRRFGGCNKQVRAKDFPAQSDEYKSLEYFLTYMMTGLEANGPASRK